MSEEASALYPPGRAPTAWFSTLRSVLEQLGAESPAESPTAAESPPPAGSPTPTTAPTTPDLAETTDAHAQDADLSETLVMDDPTEPWRPPEEETAAAEALAERLRAVSPEAADVPPDQLRNLLRQHHQEISKLTQAFGLDAPTLLVTLGRGLLPGELDPVVAAAVAAQVPELRGVISSGSVSVRRDGRTTTLIAATTVAEPTGPVRLADEYWERHGMTDVWLCAVAPYSDPLATAQTLFERILPQAGVLRAHLRSSERRRLHVGLQAVAPDADPDLVMGRLEGWRSAVRQLGSERVDIVWEQA